VKVLNRKPTFNIYELFSDLIFCTLVLFLFLILVLAINVNGRVESYASKKEIELQEIAKAEAKLSSEVALLEGKQAELSQLAAEKKLELNTLSAQQQAAEEKSDLLAAEVEELQHRRKKFDSIAFQNRVTGSSGDPNVIYLHSPRDDRYFFISSADLNAMNVRVAGSSDKDHSKYLMQQLKEFVTRVSRQRRYTEAEFHSLITSISPFNSGAGTGRLNVGFRESDGKYFISDSLYPSVFDAEQLPYKVELITADGKSVQTIKDLKKIIAAKKIGQNVKLTIETVGGQREVDAKIHDHSISGVAIMHSGFASYIPPKEVSDIEKWLVNVLTEKMTNRDAATNKIKTAKAEARYIRTAEKVDKAMKKKYDYEKFRHQPLPEISVVTTQDRRFIIGNVELSGSEVVIFLSSFENLKPVLAFKDEAGSSLSSIPDWIYTAVLNESGFVHFSPDASLFKDLIEDK